MTRKQEDETKENKSRNESDKQRRTDTDGNITRHR